VRRTGDDLPVTLPELYQRIRLYIRGAVDRNEALGSHHVQARNVSPIEPVMPFAWFIVETNDRELPVVREGECSKRGRTATHSIMEGYKS
jgi:hypothetical protein